MNKAPKMLTFASHLGFSENAQLKEMIVKCEIVDINSGLKCSSLETE